MGVYIKGMEMPTSCLKGGCPLDGFACQLWEDKYWSDWRDPERMRHPDCPLVPAPPHGRLIDADALVHSYYHAPSFPNLCKAINEAPTIIQAEEGE